MYQNFIGIDIGKDEFFVAAYPEKTVHQYQNSTTGFSAFVKAYANRLAQALIVIETTGGYEAACIRYLQTRKYAVHRANTRKVKHFIRSFGQLGKSDTLDARALAKYAYERHKELPLYLESPRKKLAQLVSRRHDLTQMLVQEKNRFKAPEHEILKESMMRIIRLLQQEIAEINTAIQQVYETDNLLREYKKVLKTIPGIGDVVASTLLAFMPELGFIDRKKIASLAGVAPHPNESGNKQGYRYMRGGRVEVKRILFIAAMTAARGQSQLAGFYHRLEKAGKKKMVALSALMRKILVIANARLRDFIDEMNSDNTIPQHS